jgi:hypothetical protein
VENKSVPHLDQALGQAVQGTLNFFAPGIKLLDHVQGDCKPEPQSSAGLNWLRSAKFFAKLLMRNDELLLYISTSNQKNW